MIYKKAIIGKRDKKEETNRKYNYFKMNKEPKEYNHLNAKKKTGII